MPLPISKKNKPLGAATAVPPTTQSAPPEELLSREERVRRFGVDCVDRIVWDRWTPGGEYPKQLVLKNLHPKLQVMQHRVPSRKAIFFMAYPEPITLTAGMQHSVEVRFRPSEAREYTDYLEVATDHGSFWIHLIARVPYTELQLPDKHDFNLCPVNVTTTTTLQMYNAGTLPVEFGWEVCQPFSISPTQGTLAPRAKQDITVTFTPKEATAVVASAICKANDQTMVMRLSGIGKYPFVSCSEDTTIDYGSVLTGLRVDKTVVVENRSLVDATFSIKRTDSDIENPFVFKPSHGQIPREGSIKIKISFHPNTSGMSYSNDFVLVTPGGNRIKWKLFGEAANPNAYLSVGSVNFGDVDVDSPQTVSAPPEKVVVLTNPSNTTIHYTFIDSDPPPAGGAIAILPPSGTVNPQKSVNITVQFTPRESINYYRRFLCTVSGQTYLLHLDVLGTGYSKSARPPPFNQHHVNVFRARCNLGLPTLTPEDVENMAVAMKEGVEPADEGEAAARNVVRIAAQGIDPTVTPKGLFATLFTSIKSTEKTPFCMDTEMVEFHGRGEPHVVHVKNLTSAKASATWCLPRTSPSLWSVEPSTADVPAFGSTPFTIRCLRAPPVHNTLECYVAFKTMRSFRLATENNFCPPVCLPLFCSNPAHGDAPVASKLSFDGRAYIAFPPTHRGEAAMQVGILNNDGDTSVHFSFGVENVVTADGQESGGDLEAMSALNDVFVIKPSFGIVPPKSRQLLTLRFRPSRDTRYFAVAKAFLNHSLQNYVSVKLLGEAYVASVELPNKACMHFRPASVGCDAKRSYTISNPSRLPLNYRWEVPDRFKDVLSVEPVSGVLKGNGSATSEFTLRPNREKKFMMHVPIIVQPTESIGGKDVAPHRQVLTCVGEGVFGGLTLEPSGLDFGTVVVGEHTTREITLFNSSLCDVAFMLQTKVVSSSLPEESASIPSDVFKFSLDRGTMRARAHETITITYTPRSRAQETFVVYVLFGDKAVPENDGRDVADEDLPRLPNCVMHTLGEYAMLQIVDIRSLFISKAHLWEQFSCTQANRILASDVSQADVETDTFSFKQVLATVPNIDMDFAMDILHTPPTRVTICLHNPTNSTVSYRFWLPDESEIAQEKWYHEEPPDQEDRDRETILDNRIFIIEPRSGSIAAGSDVTVTFSFQHRFVGYHELPVVMQLSRGKRIAIHLKGTTLSADDRTLYFPRMDHEFQPVAIGDLDPMMQYYELRNLSHQTVQYELDFRALKSLRDNNYDFPIFQCLNSYGSIPPVSSVMLRWYFRPLEARWYEVDVPILVQGGGAVPRQHTITFRGQGYHPRKVLSDDLGHMEDTEFLLFPRIPRVVDSALPVTLSLSTITFGRIPVHSLHRALVMITNTHPRDTFAFEWFPTYHSGDQLIEVDPPMGTIQPGGGRVVCKLNLYAGSTIHLVDSNIQCHVVNDSLRSRRLAERERIETENRMRLDAPPPPGSMSGGNGNGSDIAAPRGPRQRVPITTIPPQYQTTTRLQRRLEQLMEAVDVNELDEDSEDLVFVDVQPVALDLRMQFRVMPIDLYRGLYGDRFTSLHLPTVGVYSQHVDPKPVPVPQALIEAVDKNSDNTTEQLPDALDIITMLNNDADPGNTDATVDARIRGLFPKDDVDNLEPRVVSVVAEVLQDLVRTLVHDPSVQEAFDDVPEDDVPLYRDYCNLLKDVDEERKEVELERKAEEEAAQARALQAEREERRRRTTSSASASSVMAPTPNTDATATPAPTKPAAGSGKSLKGSAAAARKSSVGQSSAATATLKPTSPVSATTPTPTPTTDEPPPATSPVPSSTGPAAVATEEDELVQQQRREMQLFAESLVRRRLEESEAGNTRHVVQHGEVHSLLEEVMDGVIFSVVSDAAMMSSPASEQTAMLVPPKAEKQQGLQHHRSSIGFKNN